MKIFLSSTCYDLADVRGVLENYFQNHGHTPLLSDRLGFRIDPGMHRHEVCIQQVVTANLFILVVDRRYGAPYARDKSISITHAEFKAAVGEIPMIAFVRRAVWDERNTFRKNPMLNPTTVDNAKTFSLIDDIQADPAEVWLVTQFDTVNDIIATLDSLQHPPPKHWRDGSTPETFLERFYGGAHTDELRPVRVHQPGKEIATTVFYSRPEWVRLCVPVDSIVCELSHAEPPIQPDPEPIYTKLVESRLLFRDINLWNDPCYRLVDYDVASTGIRFKFVESANTQYLQYRFSAGIMSDELDDAASKKTTDEVMAKRARLLQRRCLWMPDSHSIENVALRFSPGGVAALFAVARGAPHHDYYVPLHIRSATLAENRGLSSVSFNGYHQWFVNREDESHLRWTIFRELYEEVFGGKEARRPSKRVKHDWYFDKPYIDFFSSHPDEVVNELVGFGFNSHVGNWECAILLVVKDEQFWERFGGRMKYSWEAERVVPISTKRLRDWQNALNMRWTGDSLVTLLNGLTRLHELTPDRFGFAISELGSIEL